MNYPHLADCMGSFSSSDTLKYLAENMAGQDAGSTIARAVFYFLAGKPDEAENYISRVKEEDIEDADLTCAELYGALLDRLSLGKYHVVPHWMVLKNKTGHELVYPFVPVFEKMEINDNRYILYLKDVCPSCKKKTVLSENGFLVPLTSPSDTVWYCPHCLAKREFSSLRVKNALWEQFRTFLARQPHREDGTLKEDALSAVICMALALYPLAPVRFGRLWTELIGHLAMNPSVYIQAKAKKVLAPSMDYIGVDYSGFMANAYLAEKWKEVFEFSPVGPQVFKVVRRTPLAVSELTTGPQFFFFDPEGLASETPAPFSFRLDEHVRARNELEKMGVPANAPFVCLHVRNKTYDEKYRPTSPDTSSRNADINTYRLAAEFLRNRGIMSCARARMSPARWNGLRITSLITPWSIAASSWMYGFSVTALFLFPREPDLTPFPCISDGLSSIQIIISPSAMKWHLSGIFFFSRKRLFISGVDGA